MENLVNSSCLGLTLPAMHDKMHMSTGIELLLSAGMRAFVITLDRVEQDNDAMLVFSRRSCFARSGLSFSNFLQACSAFLQEHSTEAILLIVRYEGKRLNSSRQFLDAVEASLGDIPHLKEINEKSCLSLARGKVLLFIQTEDLDASLRRHSFQTTCLWAASFATVINIMFRAAPPAADPCCHNTNL